MTISVVIAAVLHAAMISLLVLLHTSESDFAGFYVPGAEGGLATLPSIAETPDGGAAAGAGSARHGNVGSATAPISARALSTAITPVAGHEMPNTAPPDTSRIGSQGSMVAGNGTAERYAPWQDTMYRRGLRYQIGAGTRLGHDLALTDSAWDAEQDRRAHTIEGTIRRNLAFTPKDIEPTQRQRSNRQRELSPGTPNDIMPNIPRAGISVNFDTRSLLGLDEDVSATFSYSLKRTSHVTVIIYTMHGDTVAPLFDGTQDKGKHVMTWDARDAKGKPVEPGSYVVEIVIDRDLRITKRIVVS